jgi:hypothetical protein
LILIIIFFIYIITFKHDNYLPFFVPDEIIRQPEIANNIELYILNKKIKTTLENELNNINILNNDLMNNIKLLNNISNSNINTIIELTAEFNQIQKLINDNIIIINDNDKKYLLTNSLKPLLILDQVHNELQSTLPSKLKFDIANIIIVNKLIFKIK